MSVTSRMSFVRSAAAQPAGNLYGPAATSITGGGGPTDGPAPSSTGMAQGGASAGNGASFIQIVLGLVITTAIWWMITLVLERLIPLKETPHFVIDFLHGLRMALIVAVWFILWKMTAGVAPFNQLEPYRTLAASV